MPAVPAFAGDLRADDALATRAIMEFQYDSINRGGHSIYEKIAQAGFNPMDYIRFYNLRNYDRINTSGQMAAAEEKAGVTYEEARKQADDNVGGGFATGEPGTGYGEKPQYEAGAAATYQQAAKAVGLTTQWDTVSSCYMLNGEDIRNVPWREGNVPEIDAFVTEELYIHSKVCLLPNTDKVCLTLPAAHRRRPHRNLWLRQPKRPLPTRKPRLRNSSHNLRPTRPRINIQRGILSRKPLRNLSPP